MSLFKIRLFLMQFILLENINGATVFKSKINLSEFIFSGHRMQLCWRAIAANFRMRHFFSEKNEFEKKCEFLFIFIYLFIYLFICIGCLLYALVVLCRFSIIPENYIDAYLKVTYNAEDL